jgi:hypothetical protein
MTDLHPVAMPTVGGTVEYLSGSISRISDSRFYAVIPSRRGCLTSYKTTQADAAFRQAYNYLRRAAGLPKFPRLCSCCGQRPTWKQSHKCVVCSNSKRDAAELAQERANSAAKATTGTHSEKRAVEPVAALKAPSVSDTSNSRFRDALAKADALIAARGGSVPNGYHFEDFRERFEQRQR